MTDKEFINIVVLQFYRAEATAGEPPSIYDLLPPMNEPQRLSIKGDRENLGAALTFLEIGPNCNSLDIDDEDRAYNVIIEIINRRGRPTVAAMAFTEIS